MKIIAALAVPVLTAGMSMLATSPASAHTPSVSADCNGVHVGASSYDASMQNRWSVTIDGATQSGTFGASFDQTFPVPQGGATTPWSAYVEAADGSYHGEGSGTVGPCGTPPPVDACPDLPGSQPAGTACTPPPDVQRIEKQALDGCDVTFQGTAYGAGELTYDEEYTDTYVFNQQTNTWDLVTDSTPTVTNVAFVPWTVHQQVDHACATKPAQPPAQHTRHTSTHLDCGDQVRVTTTVTITTPYVYDAQTNTWVPGKPVRHTTTQQTPVKPGECKGAGGTSTHSHGSPGGQVVPASASGPQVVSPATTAPQVPSVVDAGLRGAPVVAPTLASAAAPAGQSRDLGLPALLLSCGVVLLAAGARRSRRS